MGFTDLPELRRRLPRVIVGLICLGTGIGLTVRARLGLSPWDVLHQGLAERLGVNFGFVVIGLGLLILLLWIPLRQRPGVGTVLNTLGVGLIADLVLEVTPRLDSLATRGAVMLFGVVIVAVGVGLYIGAGLGPGPRDGLMTSIAARGHPVWIVRTGLELSALAAGWALGGTVGVGTVVFAVGIGPLGHWFLNRFHLGVDPGDPDPDATFGE
ncbi:MAG: hypothetical protein JJE46_03015 [Acidimicrobiia bacterium]|nr:hypothetical protein [Acidimicrobiia bacterium]